MVNLQYYYDFLQSLFPDAIDLIPENFNYKDNDYALEVNLGDNIKDKIYRDDVYLQIKVVGYLQNKFKILDKVKEIDKILNNYIMPNEFWIIRENVYNTNFVDKDKYISVLMYTIKSYR
ncbi:hypothetical protein QJR52_06935 [Clostridium baratii]|uniref:hypothetical protein n=1 Tax=Clostridium baratii TaxID=1561 RepID=UPI0030CFA84F